jgi:hypothetical protein
MQRWLMSDLNPWLAWVGPAAQAVKAQRQAAKPENAALKVERAASAAASASLDYYRATRDAASEALFFGIYGNVFSLYLADKRAAGADAAASVAEPRDLPFVQDALASIDEGGYAEALARVAALLARKGEPLPLSRLQLKHALMDDYRDLLPDLPPDQWRRVRGEQEIIVRYEPDKALATLPRLLASPSDRQRLATLVHRLLGDARLQGRSPTGEQLAIVDAIAGSLDVATTRRAVAAPRKRARRAPVAAPAPGRPAHRKRGTGKGS